MNDPIYKFDEKLVYALNGKNSIFIVAITRPINVKALRTKLSDNGFYFPP